MRVKERRAPVRREVYRRQAMRDDLISTLACLAVLVVLVIAILGLP